MTMMAEYQPAHDGAGQEVNAKQQAAAVRAWAEYWGSACPDCGPQDYEFMLSHALRESAREAPSGRNWKFEVELASAAGQAVGYLGAADQPQSARDISAKLDEVVTRFIRREASPEAPARTPLQASGDPDFLTLASMLCLNMARVQDMLPGELRDFMLELWKLEAAPPQMPPIPDEVFQGLKAHEKLIEDLSGVTDINAQASDEDLEAFRRTYASNAARTREMRAPNPSGKGEKSK